MDNKIIYTKAPLHNKFTIETKKLDLEAGLLGKCFGSKLNAPSNIAGFLVVVLLVSGVVTLFFNSIIPSSEYWKIITPLITMSLGYIFGRSSKDS